MPQRRKKILLIDDEPQWQVWFSNIAGDKYEVVEASTMKDAFHTIKENPDIKLIMTDPVFLAGRSKKASANAGISQVELLRKKMPGVPIVVFSDYLDEFREELSKWGADGYISKFDIPTEDLLYQIRKVIDEFDQSAVMELKQSVLSEIRKILAPEIEKYAAIKERTIHIPGEGRYELIKPLVGFKLDIEKQIAQFPFSKNVFLMMKFRDSNRLLGEFIIENLDNQGLKGVRADHDDWNLTKNIYNPIAVLYCCKYGIALFDEPEEHQAYSPNVAYELGMMHYQNKDCLILRHASLPEVPFDLIKDLHETYDQDLEVRNKITRWINRAAKK